MKKVFILALMLPLFCLFVKGQENMTKWIEKYEKDLSVDRTVIDNRFKGTGIRDNYLVRIDIKPERSDMLEELYSAYAKDRDNAFSYSDDRVDGKYIPKSVIFIRKEKDGTDTQIAFMLNYSSKSELYTLTMIITYDINNEELNKFHGRTIYY